MSRSRHLWTAVQLVLLGVALWYAAHALGTHWHEFIERSQNIHVEWQWIIVASVLVLCTYAALIESWRMLLRPLGGELTFSAATKIWTIANLGRYIPGKVWSVGALGVLAEREGVSPIAAAGAALISLLLNIGAGLGIVAISGTRVANSVSPWLRTASYVGSACFVIGVLALPALLPRALATYARLRRVPLETRILPIRTLWMATLINVVAWIGYGLAFLCFSRGITPQITGGPLVFVAVYTASYLAGYLVLILPGGIGAREEAIAVLLVAFGVATHADALVLAFTSRLWLTVLELLPGLVSLALLSAAARATLRRAR